MQDMMTTKEAAEYIRHSEVTLEGWRRESKGPKWYKPEHKVIYLKSDLDAWMTGESSNGQ